MTTIRERIEQSEADSLSPNARLSCESKGRCEPEPADPIRTCFMRDRDRILHSKSFRRLKHKTQVFLDPQGDHYRTRLTHTLEVAQIARTMGRALRLNEDLIEAIALGHDVGHTPFGHAGENALDAALKEAGFPDGFSHSAQSLRALQFRERLNLTHEVVEGIADHSKSTADLELDYGGKESTLEAACVRICDRLAYLNHDIDDAQRAGIIDALPSRFTILGDRHSQRVSYMVNTIILNSVDQPHIHLGQELLDALNDLKDFMFKEVYFEYPHRFPEVKKAQLLVRELFFYFLEPGHLPQDFEGIEGAVDYVSGMTDRFALELFSQLRIPKVWPLSLE